MNDERDELDLRRALSARMSELGLTQHETAERLGVSQSRVSRWLHGQAPSYERVPVLARFLGATEDETLRMIYGASLRPTRRESAGERLDRVEERIVELTTRLEQVLGALEAQGLIAEPAPERPAPRKRRRRSA
jgi:transcriptional regulator with XRE-family HTH domain